MKTTISLEYNDAESVSNIIAKKEGVDISLAMLCGAERELRLLDSIYKDTTYQKGEYILLFLGVGLGNHIRKAQVLNIPVVIVDREGIADEIGILENEHTHIIQKEEMQDIYADILRTQIEYKGMSYIPLLHPFHRKIDTGIYRELFEQFRNNYTNNIWKEMSAMPRFIPDKPLKVLLLPEHRELISSIEEALQALGVETRSVLLSFSNKKQEGYALFLKLCIDFKPDFIFTINHVGLEEDGNAILHVAEAMNIPIASWFVDSPDLLIGYEQKKPSSLIQVFSWEKSRIEQLEALGYKDVCYLPLGVDTNLFMPKQKNIFPKRYTKYRSPLTFIGGLGGNRLDLAMNMAILPYSLYCLAEELYNKYLQFTDSSIKQFLESEDLPEYNRLSLHDKQSFGLYLFFYMNGRIRVEGIKKLLPLSPVIIGEEDAWSTKFPANSRITFLPNIDYIKDLPYIYQMIDININITSIQMKTAVNQRVFDCPACGAFVLTDNQAEVGELFEIGKEVAVYTSHDELYDITKFYINNASIREKIVIAGRKKVLAEHTYIDRMKFLVDIMVRRFS